MSYLFFILSNSNTNNSSIDIQKRRGLRAHFHDFSLLFKFWKEFK